MVRKNRGLGAAWAASPGAAAEGAPGEAQWHRVDWITVLFEGWKPLVGLFLLIVLQGRELIGLFLFLDAGLGAIGMLLVTGLFLLLGLLGTFAVGWWSWSKISYAVTDEAVWLRKGIFFRQQRHVRLERIQAVDVVYPLVPRLLDLGKLSVQAAGGEGSSIEIGFLGKDTLNLLRADILARAAGVVVGQQDDVPVVAAPESHLFTVPLSRLIAGALLSWGTVAPVLGILVAWLVFVPLSVLVPAWDVTAAGSFFGGLSFLLVLLAGIPGFAAQLFGEYGFTTAVSPDGIRVRKGLLNKRAETIPPRRVHAVEVRQPLLWRPFGWYRVIISQASQRNVERQGWDGDVLLPVGSLDEALLALWLVVPDLGVEKPSDLVRQGMVGTRGGPYYLPIGKRAWIFNPLTVNRLGVAVTDTCMVVRDGQLNRSVSLASYERLQSHAVLQGPVDKWLGLGNVVAGLVPGRVKLKVPHLSVSVAAQVGSELTVRSNELRGGEPPERWLRRVQEGIGHQEDDMGETVQTDFRPQTGPGGREEE